MKEEQLFDPMVTYLKKEGYSILEQHRGHEHGTDIIDDFGRSGGGLTFVSILSVFVLAILIYFYMKKRQRFN